MEGEELDMNYKSESPHWGECNIWAVLSSHLSIFCNAFPTQGAYPREHTRRGTL